MPGRSCGSYRPVPLNVEAAMTKETTIATMFRYAHVYLRALQLIVSGKIDVKPLITDVMRSLRV